MSKQWRLIQRLPRATETMVQGGLSQTSRRCGNPNCICYRDPLRLHGPHLYITYREDGKSYSLYAAIPHPKFAFGSKPYNRRRLEEWMRSPQLRQEGGRLQEGRLTAGKTLLRPRPSSQVGF